MVDNNKVTVRIFGQEYTIAGSNSSDHIITVANHVDNMMNELAKGISSLPTSSLAVLTAVNIANDYFDVKEKVTDLENRIVNLQKDADHYIQLWEDAKSSFKQYKEDAQNSVEQLQELQRIFNMKNVELNKANDAIDELKEKCAALEQKNSVLDQLNTDLDQKNAVLEQKAASLVKEKEILEQSNTAMNKKNMELEEKLVAEQAKALQSQQAESADAAESLKKYKELENSFFDIQMENLHLKDELDNLKKSGMKNLD